MVQDSFLFIVKLCVCKGCSKSRHYVQCYWQINNTEQVPTTVETYSWKYNSNWKIGKNKTYRNSRQMDADEAGQGYTKLCFKWVKRMKR